MSGAGRGSAPMPAGYLVRLARHDDVPDLPGIESAANILFEPYVSLPGRLEGSSVSAADLAAGVAESRLWVAVGQDDRPVAFALAWLVDGCGHLEELDVHPDHGRRGLGKALVESVCEWARREGLPGVTLTTFERVPFNAPFYRRLGFRPLAPHELTPHLQAILEAERALMPGLPRLAMYREVSLL